MKLRDYLSPLPLVAVLRGITPDEIPGSRRCAFRTKGFASSRCRSTHRGRSSRFGCSPTITAIAVSSVPERCSIRRTSRGYAWRAAS